MKRFILTLLLACTTSITFSQIHEVGFFVGGSNFIGDIGRTNYLFPNEFAGGLVYKYNLNPRMALRGTYTALPISGADADSDNLFRQQRNFSFTNTLHEFAAGIEYNFFEYNIRELGQTFTPYILAEVAAFNYKAPASVNASGAVQFTNEFSMSIPLGVGIKGRISDHLAFAFESAIRLTFNDELDYSTDRIASLNFGGGGNDFYTFTGFSLVYTFGRPPCYADTE
ncbi:type IX secretion system protein PorG [Tenacibaculum amylolyticum]|uniref:type IX secretion system protein PorG n=1 Tax=Tenacibaculum amylolyticum TaxID=104269 RepID=UPI0038962858